MQLELGARVFKAQAYKGTENSKQLVTTESLPGLKAFCVPPRDTKTPQKTQWEKCIVSSSKCRCTNPWGLEVKRAKLYARKIFTIKLR